MQGRSWSRQELILAFNLYCRIPFGKFHSNNPEIIKWAKSINRTSSSLSMKLSNFASLDPFHKSRNIKGLSNVSVADKAVWNEFHENWEGLAVESQQLVETAESVANYSEDNEDKPAFELLRTEGVGFLRYRLAQKFFRESVLANYDNACALCFLPIPGLLNASHIIPWNKDVKRRADPTNGITLCALHDRAFDRGLISFDNNLCLLVSKEIVSHADLPIIKSMFHEISGRTMRLPSRFLPDKEAIRYHRDSIYKS